MAGKGLDVNTKVRGVAKTCLGLIGTISEVIVTNGNKRKFNVLWENGKNSTYSKRSLAIRHERALQPSGDIPSPVVVGLHSSAERSFDDQDGDGSREGSEDEENDDDDDGYDSNLVKFYFQQ